MIITIIMPNLLAMAAPPLQVLNPWGEIQPQPNLPLAERPSTLDGGTVGFLYYDKLGGAEFTAAVRDLIQDQYTGVEFEETVLDPIYAFEQPKAWYDEKADQYDAVVISLANDSTAAYWGAVHAREFEKRGVPAVIALTSTYAPTLALAAEDHGITALRSVVIPIDKFTKAYQDMGAMIVPIADDLFPAIDAALTDNLTAAEKAPPPIAPKDALTNFGIPERSYVKQLQYFNDLAMEEGFGDGLPLTMPTREAVDEMLAATERNPDEALGKIRMRYGLCTIEKIAINAVMAGAEPEYFPVIIAAMEALVDGIEDKSLFHAALTADDNYMLMMIVSGPIAKELDFGTDRAYMTAGLRNNTTIGRAVMLAFQNIGHNTKPYVDTSRYGRHMDHTALVFTENVDQFPQGWPSHGESMGYSATQSAVTVVAVGRMGHDDQWVNNEPFPIYTDQLLLDVGQAMLLGRVPQLAGANSVRRLANLPQNPESSKDIMIYTLSPSHAALLMEEPETTVSTAKDHDYGQTIPSGSGISGKMGLGSKEGIRAWWTQNGVKAGTTGVGGTTQLNITNAQNPDIPFAAHKNVIQLLLVGENPTYSLIYPSKFLGLNAYRTQLITGATKTVAGRDATAPSQPEDFKAFYVSPDKVSLTWSAPVRTNGAVSYEVSADDGATWINVGTSLSYIYSGLSYVDECRFVVRAVNNANNARIYGSDFELSNQGSGRGAQARAIPGTTTVNITGPAAVTSVAGAFATYKVSVTDVYGLTAVQLTLRVNGSFFSTKASAGLDGFSSVGNIEWVEIGSGSDIYEGTIVLASSGSSGDIDVFEIELWLTGLLGVTEVELVDFKMAYEGGWVDFTDGNMVVVTSINQWFSPYDLNQDGVIDLRDISLAMMYYFAETGDANWAEAVIADVNEDGVVDIEDLVLIRANFT